MPINEPPFRLPGPVREWLWSVFAQVNIRTSRKLSRIPTTHETSLDETVIEQISQFACPFRFQGDWLVKIDTHYLGGGRHFSRWEVADIGILIVFRRAGAILRTKIGLLQSKRLYPDEQTVEAEAHPADYLIGFGRLMHSDSEFRSATRDRIFSFSPHSVYRSLGYRSDQYDRVLQYQTKEGIPVHYMLYNPLALPTAVMMPVQASQPEPDQPCEIGCRVIGATALDAAMNGLQKAKRDSPNLSDLLLASADIEGGSGGGWRLEHFIVNLMLGCNEGYIGSDDPTSDRGLLRVFGGRTAPISAAISIAIDAPG